MEKDYLFRYIKEGSKYILLDETNISKYINKPVMLRSAQYCIGKKLCNKCAGDMYYKLGIKNAGLTASRVSSTLLNLSMKKFHNSTTSIHEIDMAKMTM